MNGVFENKHIFYKEMINKYSYKQVTNIFFEVIEVYFIKQ